MKGRLLKKKKILVSDGYLCPIGLDVSQNPKILHFKLGFGPRISDFSLELFLI